MRAIFAEIGRGIMAKPIKDTPVLFGKEATRFLREVAQNTRRNHSAAYLRAKRVYDQVNGKPLSMCHASVSR